MTEDDQSAEFTTFSQTLFNRVREGHAPAEVARWLQSAGYPVATVRDHVAATLAIVVMDTGKVPGDDDPAGRELRREQGEYARQLAGLLLELFSDIIGEIEHGGEAS